MEERKLRIGGLFYFKNDRGTPEVYLKVTEETLSYYYCTYFDVAGNEVRDSKFLKDGQFCHNLTESNKEKKMKNFYIVWVEGSHKPPTRKFETLKEAKECCKYLIDQKGVKEAFIMKKVGVAEVPSRVKFKMD